MLCSMHGWQQHSALMTSLTLTRVVGPLLLSDADALQHQAVQGEGRVQQVARAAAQGAALRGGWAE